MFNTIRRKFINPTSNSPIHRLYFLQSHPFSSSSSPAPSPAASGVKIESITERSFTVDYLINSCEFPPEKALWASKYVNLQTANRPDSVISFLHTHGFTKPQISKIIGRIPALLRCRPDQSLSPKLHFFYSIGISTSDTAELMSAAPRILRSSLENQIIPTFNFFKKLLKSHQDTINFLKISGNIFCYDFQIHASSNIEILRSIGVPESNIVKFIAYQPRVINTDTRWFEKIVNEVHEIGFNPLRYKFLIGVHAIRSMTKATWEKKIKVYAKWGWSKTDIFEAFRKYPWCMTQSEEKITSVMDFLVNKMGWDRRLVVNRPMLISLSLEKRIVPRCLFYKELLEKGLVKKDFSLAKLLESREEEFLKHIERFCDEESHKLLRLYREKLEGSKGTLSEVVLV